jgi:thiosulfate/3-mercaptopyruvate sulfurtransferase
VKLSRRFLLLGAPVLIVPALVLGIRAMSSQGRADPWTAVDVMQPAELAQRLAGPAAAWPKIYYVGFGFLYHRHIPGSEFVGPGSRQEGLDALRAAVSKLPRNREIVIYCGCCPWDHCPNIRPAFKLLREMGFKRAKVLSLPTNFLRDWIVKDYPVETGRM